MVFDVWGFGRACRCCVRCAGGGGVSPAGQSPVPSGLPALEAMAGAGAKLAGSTRWVENAGSDTAPLPPRPWPPRRRAQALVPTPPPPAPGKRCRAALPGGSFTWSLLSTVNHIFTDNFSVSAGYKVLGVDYRKNGHVYDVRFSGPVLGLTYRF